MKAAVRTAAFLLLYFSHFCIKFIIVNLIQVNGLTKSYGEKNLFQDITFGIDKGQKVALVAANGKGKSTLLRIIAGEEIQDDGKVSYHNDLQMGYLEQNPKLEDTKTISEVIYDAHTPVISTIRKYQQAVEAATHQPNKENSDALQSALEEMDAREAWEYEQRIAEILGQFGITNLSQRAGTLSGGQKKKVALARILIQDANLLVMDEPTNHLDISLIKWLENYLSKQNMSLLLVTHDRYFLDNVCEGIFELADDGMHYYKGNFDYFQDKRAERIRLRAMEIEKAQNFYRKEIDWIRRSPKARTTKSKKRIENFESVKEVASQKLEKEQPSDFHVNMERLGKKILELKDISKAYDEQKLIEDFSYTFKKGDHIGVIGPNGIGKSTLLNIMTGTTSPDSGSVVHGATLKFGYYTQEGMQIPEGERLIDIAKDIASVVSFGKNTLSISQFLAHFNFDHTTQYNHFGNLSGGEKRRFYLIITLLKNPNFLILDEPTNDLDIFTLNVLENFLEQYQGCLLIVSHDRRFLDSLAEHTFVFRGEGDIKVFPGNYSHYEEYRLKEESEEKKQASVKKRVAYQQEKEKKKPVKKVSFQEKKEFEQLEKELAQLEEEKKNILEAMDTETDNSKLTDLSERYSTTIETIETKEMRWLELSEKMEDA